MNYYARIHELLSADQIIVESTEEQQRIDELLGRIGRAMGALFSSKPASPYFGQWNPLRGKSEGGLSFSERRAALSQRVKDAYDAAPPHEKARIDRNRAWDKAQKDRLKPKVETTPDKTLNPKPKSSRLSPEDLEKKRQADREAGLKRQREFHAGRGVEARRREKLNPAGFDFSTLGKASSTERQKARDDLGSMNAGRFAKAQAEIDAKRGVNRDPSQAVKSIFTKKAAINPRTGGFYYTPTKGPVSPTDRAKIIKGTEEDPRGNIRFSTDYGDIANLIRESLQINEKKGPCWKGYEAVGMKMKGGRKVPNCVPKKK